MESRCRAVSGTVGFAISPHFRQWCGARHLINRLFAVVARFSSHHFLLRNWLRSAGLDPDRDVRVVILPPPLVAEHLKEGQIDGFCAGEPWNSAAALSGDGWVVATSLSLAPRHPEKVLLVRDQLILRQPEAYSILRTAIVEACRFCDQPENRRSVADILHDARDLSRLERGFAKLARWTIPHGGCRFGLGRAISRLS